MSFYDKYYLNEDTNKLIQCYESKYVKETYGILVVENCPTKLNKIIEVLWNLGFTSVYGAEDATKALDFMEHKTPKLLLSSYRMEDKENSDGYKLWKHIRKLKNKPHFAIISGYSVYESKALKQVGIPLLADFGNLDTIIKAFYLKYLERCDIR